MSIFLSKLLAVIYLGMGLWLSVNHSVAPVLFPLGFVALGILAYASETLWLTALAPTLVLGSMYPWTGELVFSEYDIGLCALLGGRLIAGRWFREKPAAPLADTQPQIQFHFTGLGRLWYLAALVALVAGIRGWLVLPIPLLGDQLSIYTTNSNAFQLTKVLFYAMAMVPMLVRLFAARSQEIASLAWARMEVGFLASGMAVAASVFAERFVSVGMWDWDQELRAAGTCMTMHIGDQHIDAYWAIALPFLLPSRWSFRWTTGLRCLLLAVFAYAIFATMSRATIVSALVAAIVMLIAQAAYFHRDTPNTNQARRFTGSRVKVRMLGSLLGLAGLMSLSIMLWNSGEAVPNRFASTAEGLQTRINHWRTVLEMATQSQSRLWMGSGLGTYPLEYRKHIGRAEQPISLVNLSIPKPDTPSEKTDANSENSDMRKIGLRLVAGESIFAAQLVSAEAPLPWQVEMTLVRSSTDCSPALTVCHQLLLQSWDCVTPTERQVGEIEKGNVQRISFAFTQLPNDVTGEEVLWRRKWSPTALSLAVKGNPGEAIEVYDVRVTDAAGEDVLQNSDFENGSCGWFFVSDDHVAWRAKNCLIHLFVEIGLLGLGVVLTLCSWVLFTCLRTAFVHRSWPAFASFTSLVGLLSIGLFGTLVDTPWMLLLAILQLAIAYGLVLSNFSVDTVPQSSPGGLR